MASNDEAPTWLVALVGCAVGILLGVGLGIAIQKDTGDWADVPFPECGVSVTVHGPCDMTFEETDND